MENDADDITRLRAENERLGKFVKSVEKRFSGLALGAEASAELSQFHENAFVRPPPQKGEA